MPLLAFLRHTHYARRTRNLCAFILACVSAAAFATVGQPGTIDPTWAPTSPLGAGKLVTPMTTGTDRVRASALQADGKLVLAGYCPNPTRNDYCVVRYNTDGSLDTSFNGTGKLLFSMGPDDDQANAMAIQSDGKILVTGACVTVNSEYDFCTARLNPDGSFDTTFGDNGRVITPAGGSGANFGNHARTIAIQSVGVNAGKIVVGGSCALATDANQRLCAARYHANGTLDSTFNGTGVFVEAAHTDGQILTMAMALQADDKIVFVRACNNFTDFCTIRYSANGVLDATFNGTGRVQTDFSSARDLVTSVKIQSDQKILVSGSCDNSDPTVADNGSYRRHDFCIVRYNSNGSLDTTYNGTGKVLSPISAAVDFINTSALQSDGKLLVAGYCGLSSKLQFCIARYTTSGALDTTFNTTGFNVFAITPGIGDVATTMNIQNDGKILLAGDCFVGSDIEFCTARLDGNPPTPTCAVDLDGDSKVLATIDSLMHVRIALGLTNSAVTNGVNFPVGTPRNTWTSISNYLVGKTLDIDGDGLTTASIDSLIHARVALGVTGAAVINGITFPANATRKTWPLIRDYLVTQCGMSLAP